MKLGFHGTRHGDDLAFEAMGRAHIPQLDNSVAFGGGSEQVWTRWVDEGKGSHREVATTGIGIFVRARSTEMSVSNGVFRVKTNDLLSHGRLDGLSWPIGVVLSSIPDQDSPVPCAGSQHVGRTRLELNLFDGGGVSCQTPNRLLRLDIDDVARLVARSSRQKTVVFRELEIHDSIIMRSHDQE